MDFTANRFQLILMSIIVCHIGNSLHIISCCFFCLGGQLDISKVGQNDLQCTWTRKNHNFFRFARSQNIIQL